MHNELVTVTATKMQHVKRQWSRPFDTAKPLSKRTLEPTPPEFFLLSQKLRLLTWFIWWRFPAAGSQIYMTLHKQQSRPSTILDPGDYISKQLSLLLSRSLHSRREEAKQITVPKILKVLSAIRKIKSFWHEWIQFIQSPLRPLHEDLNERKKLAMRRHGARQANGTFGTRVTQEMGLLHISERYKVYGSLTVVKGQKRNSEMRTKDAESSICGRWEKGSCGNELRFLLKVQ